MWNVHAWNWESGRRMPERIDGLMAQFMNDIDKTWHKITTTVTIMVQESSLPGRYTLKYVPTKLGYN